MKLQTPVIPKPGDFSLGFDDKIVVLGSCFADNMGTRLQQAGFDVLVNPFGTLYNPVSIADAVARLESGTPFSESDCIEMGAGAGKICSFSHHTSFARPTAAEFLENANASLERASAFWKQATRVIITYGTARCWAHGGTVVSNCLKRPGYEFTHEMLSVPEAREAVLRAVVPGKKYLFTVSPIRHLGEGAHDNTLSKATLHLALEGLNYFPAYEILLDELRDYRFFAEDLLHPSPTAVQIIWERFIDFAVPQQDLNRIAENEKLFKSSMHRSF